MRPGCTKLLCETNPSTLWSISHFWGLAPLQDQQLAGLIMWLPGGAVFTLLTIAYFAVWLRALEKRSVRLQS
jgi:cytochrome c oxidase assembly factor CtaG